MSINTLQQNPMQAFTDAMTPKFAVSYLRVSTRGQAERGGGNDEGFSIPAQREANKRKALSMGAMVGKEFVDRGASARSADRPQLKAMLEYVKENADRVDYVIVHKVDRLARNRGDDIDIMRVLNECGVQLVSASESIDDTPAGMLLHGIMSSIAEFYSRNLATEVKKGMGEKVKNGGTPTKCPIGYKNIRGYDDKGRRDSYVILDDERAPFIKKAFEEYATGEWTLSALADHLSDLGLKTPATVKTPATAITKKQLHNILQNPYYKGVVTYNGVQYPGRHPKIIDEVTWEKVQEVLRSHFNGERTRIHDHYLKSTVYCGSCKSRLIIHNAKSRSGDRYPYFVCIGRHDKRTDCKQRAVMISEVEKKIEEIYERISFTPQFVEFMRGQVAEQIQAATQKARLEQNKLKTEKEKLEREQRKLLQAHYEDAIPLTLLKEEQSRISKSIAHIDTQLQVMQLEESEAIDNINAIFELLENCGEVYKNADEYAKRCLNQAIFKKIYVHDDLTLDAEYTEPFAHILSVSAVQQSKTSSQNEKEGKQSVSPLNQYLMSMRNYSNRQENNNLFSNGLSKELLVHLTGIEPA